VIGVKEKKTLPYRHARYRQKSMVPSKSLRKDLAEQTLLAIISQDTFVSFFYFFCGEARYLAGF